MGSLPAFITSSYAYAKIRFQGYDLEAILTNVAIDIMKLSGVEGWNEAREKDQTAIRLKVDQKTVNQLSDKLVQINQHAIRD